MWSGILGHFNAAVATERLSLCSLSRIPISRQRQLTKSNKGANFDTKPLNEGDCYEAIVGFRSYLSQDSLRYRFSESAPGIEKKNLIDKNIPIQAEVFQRRAL